MFKTVSEEFKGITLYVFLFMLGLMVLAIFGNSQAMLNIAIYIYLIFIVILGLSDFIKVYQKVASTNIIVANVQGTNNVMERDINFYVSYAIPLNINKSVDVSKYDDFPKYLNVAMEKVKDIVDEKVKFIKEREQLLNKHGITIETDRQLEKRKEITDKKELKEKSKELIDINSIPENSIISVNTMKEWLREEFKDEEEEIYEEDKNKIFITWLSLYEPQYFDLTSSIKYRTCLLMSNRPYSQDFIFQRNEEIVDYFYIHCKSDLANFVRLKPLKNDIPFFLVSWTPADNKKPLKRAEELTPYHNIMNRTYRLMLAEYKTEMQDIDATIEQFENKLNIKDNVISRLMGNIFRLSKTPLKNRKEEKRKDTKGNILQTIFLVLFSICFTVAVML